MSGAGGEPGSRAWAVGLGAAWLAAAALTLGAFHRAPWLGLDVKPHETAGFEIVAVHPDSPAAGRLKAGDTVASLGAAGFPDLALPADDFEPIPYSIRTYTQADAFFARQGALLARLQAGEVEFALGDGRIERIEPRGARPWETLPPLVPIQLLFAAIVLGLAAAMRRHRPRDPATLHLCVVALGYLAMVCGHAVYASRELAVPAGVFRLAVSLQFEAGLVLVAGGMVAALWHYPARLAPVSFPAALFAACTVVAVLNEIRAVDSLMLGVDLPLYAVLLAMIAVAVAQWRRARGRPIHRAVLKWLFIPWFLGLALYYALHLLPLSAGGTPVLSQTAAWSFGPVMFAGMTLGMTRFRLFYLNPANVKAWLASGALFVVVVALGVEVLAWPAAGTLLGALAGTGFVFHALLPYFARRAGRQHALLERVAQGMVERALGAGSANIDGACRAALEALFQPVICEPAPAAAQASVVDDGEGLLTAPLPGGRSLHLRLAYGGSSLFHPDDARLADQVCEVFVRVAEYWRGFESGQLDERRRIVASVEAGLGAQLAALAAGPAARAQAPYTEWALAAYGAVLTAFSGDAVDLGTLAGKLRRELESRCGDAGLALDWRADLPPLPMDPARALHLGRIIREAASNAIRHSGGSQLRVAAEVGDAGLELTVEDDGEGRPEALQAGNGLRSMASRAGTLGGELHFERGALGGLRVRLRLPVTRTGDVAVPRAA